jgi:hypothetical protein
LKIFDVDFKKKKLNFSYEPEAEKIKQYEKYAALAASLDKSSKLIGDITNNSAYTKFIIRMFNKILHNIKTEYLQRKES